MDKKNKTVCFTGHRDCKISYEDVYNVVLGLCEEGFLYFGVGGAVGFDMLVSKCIIDLKKIYKNIKLIVVIPFFGQEKYFSMDQKKEYYKILNGADKVVCLNEKYKKGAYLMRDRHLINNSSLCVGYLRKYKGGTCYTIKYALKMGVEVKII